MPIDERFTDPVVEEDDLVFTDPVVSEEDMAFTDPVVGEEDQAFTDPVVGEEDQAFTDPVVDEAGNEIADPGKDAPRSLFWRGVRGIGVQAADVVRQGAAGIVRDIPKQVWGAVSAFVPGETPSMKNPEGSGAAGAIGKIVKYVDSDEEQATWDDPLLEGWAGVPGQAARSLAPNILAAVATGGRSAAVMPLLYGASRAQEVYEKLRDKAFTENREFDELGARGQAFVAGGLEGGLEYVANLVGMGAAAKGIGSALKAGAKGVAPQAARGIAAGLRRLAGTMAGEAGTEAVQEGGASVQEQLLGIADGIERDADSLLDVDWEAVAERAGQAAAAGALAGGAAAGIEAGVRGAEDGGRRTEDGGQGTEDGYEQERNTEQAAGGDGDGGGASAEAAADEDAPGEGGAAAGVEGEAAGGVLGRAEIAHRQRLALTQDNGYQIEALESRPSADGTERRGVRLLKPDGGFAWSADPDQIALAQYWLKDRELFAEKDRAAQQALVVSRPRDAAPKVKAEDPRAEISRRAGWTVKPGKSVLVDIGRSKKAYPATIVDVVDASHVRVRIRKNTRSEKNNRAGYADVDIRQVRQWASAQALQQINERLAKLSLSDRKQVKEDARAFKELILEGDELVDQDALEEARSIPGRQGGTLATQEMRKAYMRAAAALGTDADLSDPIEQARALGALRGWLEQQRGGTEGLPAEAWEDALAREMEQGRDELEAVPFVFDSMTPEEFAADQRRVATAQQRVAQRLELERRAAQPLTGTAGDMTGTLAGFEGTSDIPLFTELYNVAPGAGNRTVGGGFEGAYGAESGGADAAAAVTETRAPAGGPEVETGPQERRGVGMDMRDAVRLARELTGQLPLVREKLRKKNAMGYFRPGTRDIVLAAEIFGLVDAKDRERVRAAAQARGLEGGALESAVERGLDALREERMRQPQKRPLKVMVHEIAHLVDYLPQGMIRGRGNVLGHIAALKGWMKGSLGPMPGAEGALTEAERKALMKTAQAEAEAARAEFEAARKDVAGAGETGVSAEDIAGLVREKAGRDTPELYGWFAAQDAVTKRAVLAKALKGVVDERAAAAGPSTGAGRAAGPAFNVKARFAGLVREEIQRRRLIELAAVKAEAERVIPWWRGTGAMEDYFRAPEEMYAELFGMFLADPAALEARAPVTFRAFTGWLAARPEAQRAYRDFLNRTAAGTKQAEHVERLYEGWSKQEEDELRELTEQRTKPSARQMFMGFRFGFDRRFGPLEIVAKASYKDALKKAATDTERTAARTTYERILGQKKEYLRVGRRVQALMTDVEGAVSSRLRRAGLDFKLLGEYAFHNRVAYELDGRAAAGGWEPKTSLERLQEMRDTLGEERWEELRKSWVEFRAAYERHVIGNANVRKMLGPELVKMMEDNAHYVTFAHVPTREEIARHKKWLAEQKAKGGLGSDDALDVMGEELTKRFGSTAGPQVYPLLGSFKPVENPIVATAKKAAAIIDAAYLNELKALTETFARESGYAGIREAKMEYDSVRKRSVPQAVDDGKFKTVYYMRDGELRGYVADKWLAEAFNPGDRMRMHYVDFFMRMNRFISSLYTTSNYAFYERAYIKDKQRAVANVKGLWRSPLVALLPGGELFGMATRYLPERMMRALPSALWGPQHLEYYEARARRAAIIVSKGNFIETERRADELDMEGRHRAADALREDVWLAREGLDKGFLMNQSEVVRAGQGNGEWERLLRKSGIRSQEMEESRGVATRVLDWITNLGEIREDTTKLATWAFLSDKPGLTDDQRRAIVTDWGGSPDFSERGMATGYLELMLGPFINARKEGFLGGMRALKDHPAEWVSKKLYYTSGPQALRWMLFSGVAATLLERLWPEDEESREHPLRMFLAWCARTGANIGDYYRKNYLTIPLPVDTGNPDCSLVLTIPMDESEQVVSTLTVNALDMLAEQAGIDTGLSENPVKQSVQAIWQQGVPALEMQAPLIGTLALVGKFVNGDNFYDPFRDRNVFTEDELRARLQSGEPWKKLAGEVWNRSGLGGMIKQYKADTPFGTQMPKLGEALNQPFVQPTLGKFLRVVHNGKAQAAARLEGIERDVSAVSRISARADFKRYVREGFNFSEDIVRNFGNVYYSDEFQRLNARYNREREANPLIEGWTRSKDPAVQKRFENLFKRLESYEN